MFSWLGCLQKKQVPVVMLGLDGAGKTTILYKLKTGETVTTMPTIGFNVEEVVYGNLKLTMYDIGGSKLLWKHYYTFAKALIFVVDASDIARLKESREALQEFLDKDEFKGVKLLFIANKQDIPGALTDKQLMEAFNLRALTDREWFVQSTTARTGEGIFEGLKWLQAAL
ncbi:hypothetical protein PFISCL1PPCAC_20143 [Pristionchus fissidentatus]|uniref:ADP ribosylation factor n=1 Tax=Pristionchus fissidentatus TaxID=1538716 RepID=A0AAV5W9C3_9BILA|nr:hypothetical protein PFISCL1PPCAC_20143 [Pristionchus fissidentatus]